MKKTLSLIIILLLFFSNIRIASAEIFSDFSSTNNEDFPKIQAKSAILIDANTGVILYAKNIQGKRPIASTQKLLTAILGYENIKLNEILIGDKETENVEGSKIYFKEGEKLSFENILNALLVGSANDAAVAIAKKVSGTVKDFSVLMNEKAKFLGMKNSNFKNPHGLDEKNNYSSAYDLSILTREFMENDYLKKIVAKYSFTIKKTNKQEKRYLINTNQLLFNKEGLVTVYNKKREIYDKYVNGIKTGTTNKAGKCLVASRQEENSNLIAIALKSTEKSIYQDVLALFEYGKRNFDSKLLYKVGEKIDSIKVSGGDKLSVGAMTQENIYDIYAKKNNLGLKGEIKISKNLIAPISNGAIIAYFEFSLNDKEVRSFPLLAANDVKKTALIMSEGIEKKILILIISLFFTAIFVFITIIIKRNKRKKESEKNSPYEISNTIFK